MTEFIRYQHVERLGTVETEGILDGVVHAFYKIDGTNGSVWWDDDQNCIATGSRNRILSSESDNAGFHKWVKENTDLCQLAWDNPDFIFYGEWLVPHSLKTYRDEAWRDFYVFDVCDTKVGEAGAMLPYDTYKPLLDAHGVNYIPIMATLKNPTEEHILRLLDRSGEFLVRDGAGKGEGIVLKNYGYQNKFGRQTWAKLVTNEFKEKHHKEMGGPEINNTLFVEEMIVRDFLTEAFIEKERSKILTTRHVYKGYNEFVQDGWASKMIPELLGRVWYEFIREETVNFLKVHKNPKINFRLLNQLVIRRVKEVIGV